MPPLARHIARGLQCQWRRVELVVNSLALTTVVSRCVCTCVCAVQARSREAPLMSTRTKYIYIIHIRYILVTSASMHSGAPVFTQLSRRRRRSLSDSDACAKNVTRYSSAVLLGHSVRNIRTFACARASRRRSVASC